MIEFLQNDEEIALTGYGLAEMRKIGDAIERERILPYPQRIALYDNSQAFYFSLDQAGEVLKQVQAWLVGKEHTIKKGTSPSRNPFPSTVRPSNRTGTAARPRHPAATRAW